MGRLPAPWDEPSAALASLNAAGVGGRALPSTLDPKARAQLRQTHAYQWSMLYSSADSRGVIERLTADAAVRQTLLAQRSAKAGTPAGAAAAAAPAGPGDAPTRSPPRPISGFASNDNEPALTRRMRQAATDAVQAAASEQPLASLHPLTLRSFYKRHTMDFYSAARPGAATTSQTMAMLGAGTYGRAGQQPGSSGGGGADDDAQLAAALGTAGVPLAGGGCTARWKQQG